MRFIQGFAFQFRAAVGLLLVATIALGILYPLLVTGMAKILFPQAAKGSLIVVNDKPMGSALIGQEFTSERYFWSRPSATTPSNNAAASGASHMGPRNPVLQELQRNRAQSLQKTHVSKQGEILPVDLLTASASGLDPHITPEAAYFQAVRIAKERGTSLAKVRALIERHIEKAQWGILGKPRVNVLQLNIAMDEEFSHSYRNQNPKH